MAGLGQGWENFSRNGNMCKVWLERRNVESIRGNGRRPTCLEHRKQVGPGGTDDATQIGKELSMKGPDSHVKHPTCS